MDLKARLEAERVSAMKARDKERLTVIRMILSDIQNHEIKEGKPLDEEAAISLLSRSAKMRKESITQFQKGAREDLVQKEKRELEIILEYMPKQLSTEELSRIIQKTVDDIGADSMKKMGVVMKKVMAEVAGRADGKHVQQMVREILS